MKLTFSSNGKNYTATESSVFMDNGAVVMFIEKGKDEPLYSTRPYVSKQEWKRIQPKLTRLDYEQYYGRKPLLKDINIYQIKKQDHEG